MNNRRDFMKYFGVGATIVPLVAGMPKTDAAAKLIEVPKVNLEVVQAMPKSPDALMNARRTMDTTITFAIDGGRTMTYKLKSICSSWQPISRSFFDDECKLELIVCGPVAIN